MASKENVRRGIVYTVVIGLIFFIGWAIGGTQGQKLLQSQCLSTIQPANFFKDNEVLNSTGLIELKPRADFEIIPVTATGSMRPAIADNSRLIIVNPSSIQVGDIIEFASDRDTKLLNFEGYFGNKYDIVIVPEGTRFVHRVVAIKNIYSGNPIYITKGDNNPSVDPFETTRDKIGGVVVGILY